MAELDIAVATVWEDEILDALRASARILVLLTPRSVNRPWVLMEIGAAWALKKDFVPACVQVAPAELGGPIRKYQARVIDTTEQRKSLADELAQT